MELEKEFFCKLHSKQGIDCENYGSYERNCSLDMDRKFLNVSCQYREEAIILQEKQEPEPKD